MRALVQRVTRARRDASTARASPPSAPGCSSCSASPTTTAEEEADRLADKLRALRVFADAEGRMNEPLGDREVLCVSQFTLYGDARKGNRPSYVAAARARARRAAVRAGLRAARRAARRVRRADGGRAGQRRPGDPPASSFDYASAADAARERFVCRFAAEPPQEALPYGRWADTLQAEFLAACLRSTPRARTSARPRLRWFPDRTWNGRTYVPVDGAHTTDSRCSATSHSSPATDGGRRASATSRPAPTSPTSWRSATGLADGPLRRGGRRLARRERRPRP